MLKIIISCLLLFFVQPVFATDYSEVDARAKNTPVEKEQRLETLVRYLIEPYRSNDELKARAIFAWIAYHVEYDNFKYDVITENKKGLRYKNRRLDTGDAFKTRIGVCGDIANLFQRMAKIARLESEEIRGYAGYNLTMNNFKEAGHAWNAVKIKGKWFFVDATWGMGGDYLTNENVDSFVQHRRDIRERKQQKSFKVNENRYLQNEWFLVEPKKMIETHFPRQAKHQHLKQSIDMKKVFRKNARKMEK